jgi:hypothetical protein
VPVPIILSTTVSDDDTGRYTCTISDGTAANREPAACPMSDGPEPLSGRVRPRFRPAAAIANAAFYATGVCLHELPDTGPAEFGLAWMRGEYPSLLVMACK